MDVITEAQLYRRLLDTFSDACIVSSVHRLHLLLRFDTVILMEHGRIIDRGTPRQVAHRRPAFASTATSVTGLPQPSVRPPL